MIDIKTIVMFNASSVVDAVDRATRKTLSKAGAFVRQTAKRSIRKRKAAAPAGSPPSSHEGSLKRLIVFGFDPQREEVVVGPMRFPSRAKTPRETVPATLEFGGSMAVRGRRRTWEPRPFMGPALEKEVAAGTIESVWAGAIK